MIRPPDPAGGPVSVGRRLLLLLLVPLGLLLLAGVLIDYSISVGPVRRAFDRSLGDAALIVATYFDVRPDGTAPLELPPAVLAALAEPGDSLRFSVWDRAGRHIGGDRALSVPVGAAEPQPNPYFRDALLDGEAVRIAVYAPPQAARALTVVVAERTRARDRPTRNLLTATLLVDVLQLIAVLLLVVAGVRAGLQPLLALRDHLAARSARELEPLDERSVPTEVRTLVASLNALFGRLRAAADAQQRFLADAAHQLRTPLAGMQAQLELLERDAGASPARERLREVRAAIRRLAHTAHQLLTLARAESAGTLVPDAREVDLPVLIEETVTAELDRALAKGIDLGAEATPARVTGVDWLLRELLNNLTDNALNYTAAGGAVTLRCGRRDGGVFIEVEDDGPGIPEAERPRVTERFQRAAGAGGSGTGLGLAIVSDIAAAHGARLVIAAGTGGRGTLVRVVFAAPGTTAG